MRLVSRASLLALGTLAVLLSSASRAEAQRASDKSNSQFLLNRGTPGGPAADAARARARGGDCKGALPIFDSAITLTIEPTLRRDRGLCHEKLEHVHPAIDDYRAYLTARPDAPDADDIRARLGRLEEAAGVGGPSEEKGSDDGYEKSSSGGKAEASMSIGTSGTSASASGEGDTPEARAKAAKDYDAFRREQRSLDIAEESPLRRGTGVVLGVYAGPRWGVGEGSNSDTAFHAGGTLRYAATSAFSMMLDLGYVQSGDTGRPTGSSGFGTQIAAELRLHLNQAGDQAIILGIGPGFERYTSSVTRLSSNLLLGRARAGFRFVFGPAVALEITFDPAIVYTIPQTVRVAGVDVTAGGTTGGLLGGGAAFLVAF